MFPEEKAVYLIFQESDSDIDWKNNYDFWVTVYKNQQNPLKAHRGFVKAWKSGNDEVMADFISACNENPTFQPYIIGWSHGGAISQLAVEDFYFRTKKKAIVYTFGSPNVWVGKKSVEYVRSCCLLVKQYAQHNDIVASVPPFYHQLNKVKVGTKFGLLKFLFCVDWYHTTYDLITY